MRRSPLQVRLLSVLATAGVIAVMSAGGCAGLLGDFAVEADGGGASPDGGAADVVAVTDSTLVPDTAESAAPDSAPGDGAHAGDASDGAATTDAGSDAHGCTNMCTVNLTQCAGGTVQTCETGANGCTTWVTTQTCGAHQSCAVSKSASCTCTTGSFCESEGVAGNGCQSSTELVSCGEDDAGCFYALDASACPGTESCGGSPPDASCSATCSNSCTPGTSACVNGLVTPCTLGTNGCYAYGTGTPCPASQACVSSAGTASCACSADPYCSPGATSACDGSGSTIGCVVNTSGCTVNTGSPSACPAGSSCSGGTCYCGGTSPLCGGACCTSPEQCVGASCACPSGGPLCGGACCAAGQVCGSTGACSVPVSAAASSTLQLWLAADYGLQCSGGTATGWTDRSTYGDDATTTTAAPGPTGSPVGSHLGPSCNVSGHTINGIPVPYFPDPAGGPPFVDGTFDVNLGFLANNPQVTIFVVERRWAPQRSTGADSLFIGTESPNDTVGGSSTTPVKSTLQVGYVSYNQGPSGYCQQLSIDFGGSGAQNAVPPTTAGTPSALSIDTFRNSSSTGMVQAWSNGYLLSGSNTYDTFSPSYAAQLAQGSIGRALRINYTDERFNGDIAEVLVFDSALSEPDRQSVETYLETHWGGVTKLTGGGGCP